MKQRNVFLTKTSSLRLLKFLAAGSLIALVRSTLGTCLPHWTVKATRLLLSSFADELGKTSNQISIDLDLIECMYLHRNKNHTPPFQS